MPWGLDRTLKCFHGRLPTPTTTLSKGSVAPKLSIAPSSSAWCKKTKDSLASRGLTKDSHNVVRCRGAWRGQSFDPAAGLPRASVCKLLPTTQYSNRYSATATLGDSTGILYPATCMYCTISMNLNFDSMMTDLLIDRPYTSTNLSPPKYDT